MASSTADWKPVSRRTVNLPGGFTMRRRLTGRTFHAYTLEKGGFPIRDFALHSRLEPGKSAMPYPHHAKFVELTVAIPPKGGQSSMWGSPQDFFSVGSDVVRAASRAIKKIYPNLRWISGSRVHKDDPSGKRKHPVTIFPMSKVK